MVNGMDNNIAEEDYEKNVIYGYNVNKIFYSNYVGGPIVNAVTGAKYPWEVGSFDEKKFFKVRSNVAYGQKKGNHTLGSVEAGVAFYESPYEYMKHTGCVLSDDIVATWKENKGTEKIVLKIHINYI